MGERTYKVSEELGIRYFLTNQFLERDYMCSIERSESSGRFVIHEVSSGGEIYGPRPVGDSFGYPSLDKAIEIAKFRVDEEKGRRERSEDF